MIQVTFSPHHIRSFVLWLFLSLSLFHSFTNSFVCDSFRMERYIISCVRASVNHNKTKQNRQTSSMSLGFLRIAGKRWFYQLVSMTKSHNARCMSHVVITNERISIAMMARNAFNAISRSSAFSIINPLNASFAQFQRTRCAEIENRCSTWHAIVQLNETNFIYCLQKCVQLDHANSWMGRYEYAVVVAAAATATANIIHTMEERMLIYSFAFNVCAQLCMQQLRKFKCNAVKHRNEPKTRFANEKTNKCLYISIQIEN